MSVLNSDWSHNEEHPILREADPPANSDKDSGDTSAQGPTVWSFGLSHLDANPAPSWPGLRALLQQLPPQDSDVGSLCPSSLFYSHCLFLQERYCLALGEEELAGLKRFCAQRRREALGQGVARLLPPKLEGHTCEKCRQQLRPGEYGVFAARAGERRCWHQPCFACQACGQALINLIYFYHDGRLYCGRHHAELLRPRCPACDQLIFSQHCTEAEGRRWHKNHFCCQDCAGPLDEGRYALPGGGPCCPSCFHSRYSEAATAQEGKTRGLGPAALTARPWPEHSKGLQNPPSATVWAAAPDSLPGGGHNRSLVGGGREGGGREGGEPRGTTRGCSGGAHARGRGWRRGPALFWLRKGRVDPDQVEGALNAEADSRAVVFTTAASSSPETQRGQPGFSLRQFEAGNVAEASKKWTQGPPETSSEPREDFSCPTCSSSSDSEPEGFFFGQRLPLLRETPNNLPAVGSDASGKPCAIC
ncbi:prickle-like protein 4 [Rhynchocyon petersi]